MTPLDDILIDALQRLLSEHCTPETVRRIEAGHGAEALWQQLEASGFADALLPEEKGGAGLCLQQAFPLIELCGRHCVAVPLAQTMVARALISASGETPPAGSIALARARPDDAGGLVAEAVSYGQVADWILAERDGPATLLRAGQRERHIFPLDASLRWTATEIAGATAITVGDVRLLEAAILAAQIAGASLAVFEQTLAYANDRLQFGRPLGKFQAIQHQLSVMAEQVFAARMAAQIGCSADIHDPTPLTIAAAKARTSSAVVEIAAIAHAIHGAIGFTAELDLQLFTRRLYAWRIAAGAESYWQNILGNALFERRGPMLDLLRDLTDMGNRP